MRLLDGEPRVPSPGTTRVMLYVIELYPGCKGCSAPPGVIVRKVDAGSILWNEVKELPLFPLTKVDDYTEACIKCGPDPDEFRKQAVPNMLCDEVDEVLADILAEDIWEAVLRKMPEVIEYRSATLAQK